MSIKNKENLVLTDTISTKLNGNLMKNHIYYDDKTNTFIAERENAGAVTIHDNFNKQSVGGLITSFDQLFYFLLKVTKDEYDLDAIKIKAKQLDYFIGKLEDLSAKGKIDSNKLKALLILSTEYCLDEYSTKSKNLPLLKEAYKTLVNNSKLHNYIELEDETEREIE